MWRHVRAVFNKQLKDTIKNKTVLIQFVMFPAITLVMTRSISDTNVPANFFVTLFASMYIGMAPLTVMAAIVAEEKEKNTLRMLRMAGVRSSSYLTGTGTYVLLFCLLGAAGICACGDFTASERAWFMAIMAVGILISILVGASIGTVSRTQMMATSLTVPVMLVLAFVPMLSQFNAFISEHTGFLYSRQISILLGSLGAFDDAARSFAILGVNMVVAAALFTVAYRKCELA